MKNGAVRVTLVSVDDTDKIQRAKVTARDSEVIGEKYKPLRHQPSGLTSNPTKGIGLALYLEGNTDQAMVIVLENPDKRPKGIDAGATKLYDEGGQSLYLKNSEAILTCTKLTITVTGEIVIDGSSIKLGSGATKLVKLADGSNATKVKAE